MGLAPLREERLELAGFSTRALSLDGDGPPVVLLHGFADSADTWRAVLQRLRLAGRAALALDLPGFAHADPLEPQREVLVQLAEFATAAAAHAGTPVLAGNSLGGSAALLAAAAGADVAGVVPIAPAGFDMGHWYFRVRNFWLLQALLRAPPILPTVALRVGIGRIFRELAVCEQRTVDGATVSRFAAHFRDRETILRYLGVAERIVPEVQRPMALETIRVPVHVLWGERDRLVPARNAELLRAQVPHAEVEVLARCGHCPQIECPAVVAKRLGEFP